MESDLAGTYDAHTLADTFLRYTQSTRLLALLCKHIGDQPAGRHLDIGFSGRLALFSCLSSSVSVMNMSQTQLRLGLDLLPELLRYAEARVACEEDARDFIWDRLLPDDVATKVRRVVDGQIEVLNERGQMPWRPSSIQIHHGDFTRDAGMIAPSSCDSLTMIDILLHIGDVQASFLEIRRILAPGGSALITFYPPSRDRRRSSPGVESVDQILLSLAHRHGISSDEVHDEHAEILHTGRLRALLEAGKGALDDGMLRRYWLDLERVMLHSTEKIETCARAAGLRVERLESVPGGMFQAARSAVVLTIGEYPS